MDDVDPPFFIGHHDDRRVLPISAQTVRDAHAANYDMLTSPITTPHFHSRVLTLLSSMLPNSSPLPDRDGVQTLSTPIVVSPLTPADTPLTPDDTTSQIIGVSSPWIDLCSLDPIIADVSRQVLKLELSYAAFCGLTYVLIPGPKMRGLVCNDSGLLQYARAILDGLGLAPYMQLYVWLPMIDHSDDDKDEIGDLTPFARQCATSDKDGSSRLDIFGTWEAWNEIRSLCKYSSRLSVGKTAAIQFTPLPCPCRRKGRADSSSALSLPRLLPPVAIQSRWYSEPVRLFTLEANVFSKNPKGYPVLSKAHQALVTRFVRLRNPPWFLLCNCGPIPSTTNGNTPNTVDTAVFPTPAESSLHPPLKDPTPQLSYMRNLQAKQPPLSQLDRFGTGYQDYLQAPLQPLTVNLESVTYEVFEKDPVKYDWYEKAVARALHDWIEQAKPTSNPDGRVVVAVVGAGRGPLVTRALKASEDVGVEIDMWALEKNPNAFVLLQRHNESIWNRRVNLVKSDMRTWRGPVREANAKHISQIYNMPADEDQANTEPQQPTSATYTGSPETDSTYLLATATHQPTFYKIDILISELLGSFADNELSPECLDGVQHLLNPVHGISIPASYTAFISPISTPKLYADINNSMLLSTPNAAEIPYVVMLSAIDHVSTSDVAPSHPSEPKSPPEPHHRQSFSRNHRHHNSTASVLQSPPEATVLPTWAFQHPNSTLPPPSSSLSNNHNARFSSTSFPVTNRATIHGLAGYFESVLYPGVELSTNPLTMDAKSEGMISWFPIYFPLKSALFVPDHSEVQVSMWRKTDEKKVWYEWQVDAFIYQDGSGPISKGKTGRRGKRMRIGGSELHSSEKEGCLM